MHMRRIDRRGMELAVNTLVVMILGVIIVGGGIALMYSIFNKARVLPGEVDKTLEQELFNILLGSKDRIAVLNNAQTVARGDTATFAVAIQNQVDNGTTTFTPVKAANASVAPNPLCTSQTANNLASCPLMDLLTDSFTLNRSDHKAFYVNVAVPRGAMAGEYVYNVDVLNATGSNLYAREKVYVTVE